MTPFGPTLTRTTKLQMGDSGGPVFVSVEFKDIPPDGTYSVSVPGPDPENTISVPQSPVPRGSALVSWKVNYPAQFQTSITVSYWQGPTPLQPGADIQVYALSSAEGNAHGAAVVRLG